MHDSFNPKKAWVNLTSLWFFHKCTFQRERERQKERDRERQRDRERVKPCVFVTFNNIMSNIFLENLIEIPKVVQKI